MAAAAVVSARFFSLFTKLSKLAQNIPVQAP